MNRYSAFESVLRPYSEVNVIPIQAHRGGGIVLPESTMETFEETWGKGLIPETDIRTTVDDVIICVHDPNAERIAPDSPVELRTRPFGEMDLATVQTIDVGSWRGRPGQFIPTLEHVLQEMQGRPERFLYMDYKDVSIDRLARLVQRYAVSRQVIFTTCEHELIVEWKRHIPDALTLLWIGGGTASVERKFRHLLACRFEGVSTLQIHVKRDDGGPSKDLHPGIPFLVDRMKEVAQHDVLFQVIPWEISDPDVYRSLMELGVRSFATDFPDETLAVYREFIGQ
jgi:glycerophosphoryl diester phosphodiesterase